MRQRLLDGFDELWFDCMNGDSRETGKLTPEGKPDPSVFSTEYNREGIRVGTAIALMVRKEIRDEKPTVNFRHFWGVNKKIELLESLTKPNFEQDYQAACPSISNRFSLRPSDVALHYLEWAKLTELCAETPINGLFEKRGGALIDVDKDALSQRMEMYYNLDISWEMIQTLNTGLTEEASGFEPKKVRTKVQNAESYSLERIHKYAVRPFDVRWCYYSDVSPLWNRSRPTFYAQFWKGNSFLMSRPAGAANTEGVPMYYSKDLGDNDFLRGHAYYFPLRLRSANPAKTDQSIRQMGIEGLHSEEDRQITANLSAAARNYLTLLGITDPDSDPETAALIWMHVLAISYSPAYLEENADGVRQDWLRIPLPDRRETLIASANIGRQIAALLDPETPVPGITSGKLRPELKIIAVVSRVGTGNLDPNTDFALTTGWGHAGQNNVTMPGKGKISDRPYTPEEQAAIAAVIEQLGTATHDIYLNDIAYWKNIPDRVWSYTIGGYQVIKKWLSYREQELLGRPLKLEEVTEVTHMARRIAAILLLEPELDANYEAVKQSTYQWSTKK